MQHQVAASLGTVLDGERYSDEALAYHYEIRSIFTNVYCIRHDLPIFTRSECGSSPVSTSVLS
jgi:hypothetical protein